MLAFSPSEVVVRGELKGGAAMLAQYSELRVRMRDVDDPSEPVQYLSVKAHEDKLGANALRVELPAVQSARVVELSLVHVQLYTRYGFLGK